MNNRGPNQHYLLLAQKWLEGIISEEELKEYTTWLKEIDPEAVLEIPEQVASNKEAHRKIVYDKIRRSIEMEPTHPRHQSYRRILYVAAVFTGIILVGYLSYLYVGESKKLPVKEVTTKPVEDIQPGITGAVLHLGNGKVIILDTASNGYLQNNILKNQGAVVFENASDNDSVQYNTLATPRARLQQLILPDGSHIWLNAESSIRFPSKFTGNTREVEITGEAYFEVAPNKAKPFIINVKQSSVIVVGTQFNVMAYPDEAYVETTLLEGSVKFRNNQQELDLRPGQQSRLSSAQKLQLVVHPDLELVMAWKNGFQSFRNTDIKSILRQITRWYDVEVEFIGDIPSGITYSGDIPREVTLLQLLKALESEQLHFMLDAPNKKLSVDF
jgi:hypothetical protein